MAKSVNSRHNFFKKLWHDLLDADAIFHGNCERDQISFLQEKVLVLEEKIDALAVPEPAKNAKENALA